MFKLLVEYNVKLNLKLKFIHTISATLNSFGKILM